jgi:hypothetical protein
MTAHKNVARLPDVRLRQEFRGIRAWAACVVIAAFGPYIFPTLGIRTEQLVIYGSALVLAPVLMLSRRVSREVLHTLAAWTALCLVAMLATVAAAPLQSGRSVLAGLDSFLMPIAALTVAHGWSCSVRPRTGTVLESVALWIVLCVSANTCVSLYGTFGDITPVAQLFWSTTDPMDAVAARAAEMGRQTGLFNQPFEAGLAYSLGLFSLSYLRASCRLSGWSGSIMLGLILVGGLLTVSKVFLLVGLPIAIFSHFMGEASGRTSFKTRLVTALCLLVALVSLAAAVPPEASDRLRQLVSFQTSEDPVALYSAGRFGEGGSMKLVYSLVIENSPALGFGLRGIDGVAYDNAWIEMLVMAGLIGAALYSLVLVIMVLGVVRRRTIMSASARMLSGSLLGLLVFAGLGGPALTANRAAVLIWLLFGTVISLGATRPALHDNAEALGAIEARD